MSDLAAENARLRAKLDAVRKRMKKFGRRSRKEGRCDGMIDGICAMLRPGQIAVDCGANIGNVTEKFSKANVPVYAFEPDPWSLNALKERFSDTENVQIISAAVGAENGVAALFRSAEFERDPTYFSQSSTVVAGATSTEQDVNCAMEVPVISLPEWIKIRLEDGQNIGVLKMDIEGSELEVLNALHEQGLLKEVGALLVETHEFIFPDLAKDFADMRALLSSNYPSHRINLEWR